MDVIIKLPLFSLYLDEKNANTGGGLNIRRRVHECEDKHRATESLIYSSEAGVKS